MYKNARATKAPTGRGKAKHGKPYTWAVDQKEHEAEKKIARKQAGALKDRIKGMKAKHAALINEL